MPAHSEDFPWPSYYRNYNFFESRMRAHNKITDVEASGDGFYVLTTTAGDTIRVFICECYSFGVAEYHEANEKLGKLNAIIINSNWCGYSYECKKHCRDDEVGLFDIRDFMAALNCDAPWNYLNESDKEYFQQNGWL